MRAGFTIFCRQTDTLVRPPTRIRQTNNGDTHNTNTNTSIIPTKSIDCVDDKVEGDGSVIDAIIIIIGHILIDFMLKRHKHKLMNFTQESKKEKKKLRPRRGAHICGVYIDGDIDLPETKCNASSFCCCWFSYLPRAFSAAFDP